ncbi:hypothetical protein KCU71_g14046, partial [Aureobasidium melanogenum]
MLIAMLAFCAGQAISAFMPVHQTYWPQMFVSILIMPFGMDMSFPAATVILSNHMPREHQGLAASLVNTMVNYSISLALGIAGTVEVSVMTHDGTLADTIWGVRCAFYTGLALAGCGVLLGELASLQVKLGVDYKKKIDEMLKEMGFFDWEKFVYESNMGSQLKAAKQKTEETNTAEQPKTAMAGCANGDNYNVDLIDDDSSNEAGGFQFYGDGTTGPDAHAEQGTHNVRRLKHTTHVPTTQSMPEAEAQQSTPPSPAHDDDAPTTQRIPGKEIQEFNSTPPEYVDAEPIHEVIVHEVDTRQGEHISTHQQEKREGKRKPQPVIKEWTYKGPRRYACGICANLHNFCVLWSKEFSRRLVYDDRLRSRHK